MSAAVRLSAALVLMALLGASVGCQTPGAAPNGTTSPFLGPTLSAPEESSSLTGEGRATAGRRDREGGGLLRTGAIMLGPGVGRNWWRWQGDGQWGF